MDSDPAEAEAAMASSAPKLPLFSMKGMANSLEHPGTATPPHQSSLSVPFRWEEEPGKPRPCLALATLNDTAPKSLELPPRLLCAETKLPSPTTVLDGPYVGSRRFRSLSFRTSSERHVLFSPERGLSLGALVLRKRGGGGFQVKSWFSSWRGRRRRGLKGSDGNNKEVSGGSYVFPSSGHTESDDIDSITISSGNGNGSSRITRAGSFSSLTRPSSHFWGTIYEGLKQAVPWKSKKMKKRI